MLMLSRLTKYFEQHYALDSHQHGFRPKHFSDLLNFVTLDKCLTTIALLIEVSKAFDV